MAPDPDFEPDLHPDLHPDLEHDLGRLLVGSVQDLHPPVAVMLAEATRRGRVLRRRRRLATAASAAAVLTLAAAVTLTGLPDPLVHSAGPAAPTAAGSPTAGSPTDGSPTDGSASTRAASDQDELRQRQRAALQDTLARLIGPGTTLDAEAGGDQLTLDPATDAVLWTRYDDGQGAATVSVEVHGPASGATAPSCGARTDAARAAGYSCTTAGGPGPAPQIVEVLVSADTGWTTYRIWTPYPDGTRVGLAVHNGTMHDADDPSLNPHRTRSSPPIDLARWQQIAADEAWQQVPGLRGAHRP
ncbi:hypothetical protein [Kitasatospora sp. A2-31]|uniref:hypothetical protein n=1 Tax=Kitasatospora sp. A2-31 TaxID=2916414 RepID=UPI001EE96CBA|nr:hypothetical protein [Kitasatospora sp. A2-31]MCG6493272.1 hypothetical protein [Kitasatospora sp. A2-31]